MNHPLTATAFGPRNGTYSHQKLTQGVEKESTAWDVYNNEARKVDTELVKDWTANLNFLLLFAAIFAAVLTGFIIESMKMLKEDSTDVLIDIMIHLTNGMSNGTHTAYSRTSFDASFVSVSVNSILFASLCSSLAAALASIVALQWVADFDAAITRGGSSPEDRAKRRQFRYAGVGRWGMVEIIAILPILLHFSVALFFAGMFQWMWSINHSVGHVLVACTGLIGLFYVTTTVIGTVDASSPFRTPLSRWLYSLSNLPFYLAHNVYTLLNPASAPAFLHLRHARFTASLRREDEQIRMYPELGRDALNWLAEQLPISSDSLRRFTLLAHEVIYTPSTIPSLTQHQRSTWYAIFDILGGHYLQSLSNPELVEEARSAISSLIRCNEKTWVRDIISWIPSHSVDGTTSRPTSGQPSKRQDGQSFETATHENGTFQLMRNIPTPVTHSEDETKAAIRLMQHRSSGLLEKFPVWQEVFQRVDKYHAVYSQRCLKQFKREVDVFIASEDGPTTDLELDYPSIYETVERCALEQGISNEGLLLLIQTFEKTTFNPHYKHPDEVDSPQITWIRETHGSQLRSKGPVYHRTYFSLLILLARAAPSSPLSERQWWVTTLVSMLWLVPPSRLVPHCICNGASAGENVAVWSICPREPAASFNTRCRWCKKLGWTLTTNVARTSWINDAHLIPYITEVLFKLNDMKVNLGLLGRIWLCDQNEREKWHSMARVFLSFDRIIGNNSDPDLHLALIELLIRDLQNLEPFPASFSEGREHASIEIEGLGDPSLVMLFRHTLGVPTRIGKLGHVIPNVYTDTHKRSLLLIATLVSQSLPLRITSTIQNVPVDVWPAIIYSTENAQQVFNSALCNVETLIIFRNPSILSLLGYSRWHILFYLLQSADIKTNSKPRYVHELGADVNPILAMLAASEDGVLSHPLGSTRIAVQCLELVQEMCTNVKRTQSDFTALISDIMSYYTPLRGPNAMATMATLVQCLELAVALPNNGTTASALLLCEIRLYFLNSLSHREYLRNKRKLKSLRSLWSDTFDLRVGGIVTLLRDRAASKALHSPSNLRSLCCVRRKGTEAGATGWLSMHLE